MNATTIRVVRPSGEIIWEYTFGPAPPPALYVDTVGWLFVGGWGQPIVPPYRVVVTPSPAGRES